MYKAYLVAVQDYGGFIDVPVGEFKKLSIALVEAIAACYDKGLARWDWVVDKISDDGTLLQRRSSIGGFEPLA
jgi:hypothetical protein